jgi:transposase
MPVPSVKVYHNLYLWHLSVSCLVGAGKEWSYMGYIKGVDRNQVMLMPEYVEDYVAADNPVRVIDAFVEGLDMATLGFQAEPAFEGRPGYNPRDMLKLYIYGYNNKIRSSRRLQTEARRNLELIWLL